MSEEEEDEGWWEGPYDETSRRAPSLEPLGDILKFSPQRWPTGWCADREQSPGNQMHSNSVTIGNSIMFNSTQVRPLQQIINGVVICDDTDEQNVNPIPWINEEELRQESIVWEKLMACKGKEKAAYGMGKESKWVQRLQDFGNELDQNVSHIHEETERIEAMAWKGKATYVGVFSRRRKKC